MKYGYNNIWKSRLAIVGMARGPTPPNMPNIYTPCYQAPAVLTYLICNKLNSTITSELF